MYIITVTSIADSGAGSFREALELAAAYTGGELVQIQFDASLAGQVIELKSEITVSTPLGILNLQESPVRICGQCLNVDASVELHNMVLDTLMLSESATITGEGNVINSALHVSADADLSGFSVGAGSDDACVYLSDASGETPAALSDSAVLNGSLDVVIESGTWSFNARQQYTGNTTVNAGATLVLNQETGSQGVIAGTVNVLGTLELAAGDCTGYSDLSNSIRVINIGSAEQGGGELHISTRLIASNGNLSGPNQTFGSTVINMYAGSITGVEGSNFDMFSKFNTAYPAAINVYAVAGAETSRSYINTSMVRLRQNDTNIMVDSAAELIINAQLSNGDTGNHKLIKTGAGKLTLTNGSSNYTGGTEIRGGELLVEADALGSGAVLVASGCLNIVACEVNQGSNTVTIQSGGSLKMKEAELDAAGVSIQGGAQAVLNSSILHDLTVEAGAEVEMTGCSFVGNLTLSMDADCTLSGNDFSNVEQFVFTNVAEGKTIDLSGNSWGTLDRDEILARFGAMAQYVELGEILAPVDSITYVVNSMEASGAGSLAGAITRLNATTGDKTVILDLSGLEDGVSIQLPENLPVITKSCAIIGANTVLVGTLRADGAQIDFRNITLESFAGSNGAGYVLDDESAIATYRIVSDEGIVLGSDSTCDVTESLRSNGGALIESGIWRFNVRQAYDGPTTVCAGATLVLNSATGRNGVVKGTVNVLGTLELAAGDCTGWENDDESIRVINLGNAQQGGAVMHVSTSLTDYSKNQTLGGTVINMYGSSITGVDGSNVDLFTDASAVNVYAVEGGASESVIGVSTLQLRQSDSTFMVDAGASLVINSLMGDRAPSMSADGNHKLIKTGAGKLVLTNAGNVYSGGTEINAGTLEVSEGASISRGAVTVADGAALLLSAANINLGSNEITVQNGGTLTATEGTSIAAGAVRIEAGASAVLTGVQASHVVIEAGANVTITDAAAINKLTISLDAGVVSITGNEFSQTQIILTDVEEGRTLDLSGNNWGTESLYEIFAKAGEWAPYITVDGKTVKDMEDILVTNTDDSGPGSLRAAIERAKEYREMGVTTPRIVVSPELAGQSIVPSSPLPALDVDCVIDGNGIVIEHYGFVCKANVEINNLTSPGLVLYGDYSISGEGLVLTHPYPVQWDGGNGAAMDWSGITFTAENPGIALQSLWDGTLSLPPSHMLGVYMFIGDTTLKNGDTLTLEDGVVLGNALSLRLTIEGTLQASYTEAVDVFKSGGPRFDVFVQNGGALLLENANVNLAVSSSKFRVQEGGTLEMTGGFVDVADSLRVYTGGAAELAGVSLQSAVSVEGGSLSLENCAFDNTALNVGAGSTLSLCNTSGISTLTIDGSATITAITGNDFSATALNLTNFAENQTIDLSGNEWGTDDINEIFAMLGSAASKVTIDGQTGIASNYFVVSNTNNSGAGSLRDAIAQANAYTGEEIPQIRFAASLAGQTIQLSSALPAISADCVIDGRGVRLSSYALTCSGDVELNDITLPQLVVTGSGSVSGENITLTSQNAVVLNSAQSSVDFSGITATAADAYVSINPASLPFLSALPASFSGGYRLQSAPTVSSGTTLTLADGVMLSNSTSMQMNVYGTLQARYTETVDAFKSAGSWFDIFVQNGGKLLLENANAILSAGNNWFRVYDGGALEMTGGSVKVGDALRVYSGGSASLTDVSVLSGMYVAGAAELANCSFNNNALYVQSGASFSLVNSTGLGTLYIEGSVNCENITGNDFTNTTLNFTNVSAGSLIDLSGNEWGTDDIGEIFDKLGSAGAYVVIDGYTQDGLGVFNVTNRNNSGLGSLRSALLSAASYTGEVVPRIIVNPDMAGQTISLSSALTAGGEACIIEGNGVILTNHGITCDADVTIKDITMPYVRFENDSSITYENVTLTATIPVYLAGGNISAEDLAGLTFTATNAMLGISELWNGTLSSMTDLFPGGYVLTQNVILAADETLDVEDGVSINMQGGDIDIYGTFNAEYSEVSALLTTTGDYAYLNIQDGGQMNLKNASLNIGSGSLWGRVSVLSGGVLNMEGGDLFANYYHVQIAAGGQATLVGTRVRSSINNSGTLSMMGVNSSSYIEAWGTTLLDGVTCTTLCVDSSSDVSTGENGVTLTSAEAFRLVNFCGNVGDLLDSLTLTTTAAGAYVGISGSLNTSTLSVLPESLAGTYRLVSDVSVAAEQTVTVEEGVSINMQGYDLNVYGSLNAEYDEVGDLLTTTGDYAYLNIQDGGQVNLKNASLNIGSGSFWGRVSVLSGGVLNMEGGNLFANHYHVQIAAGGQATLVGTSVRSSITNSGMLSMTGVNSTSYIEAWGTTLLDGVTCTSLYVDSASDVSVGEGGVTLTGTEALRLVNFSGNVGDFLDSLTLTATAAGAYVGISGTLYTSTLSALPESLTGNYRLVSNVSVAADETVTVEDGVSINMQGYGLNVDGTLNAEYDEVSDLLTTTGNSAYLYISDGGQVNLKNTSLNIGSNGRVSVLAGGSLNMEGGSTCAYITSSGSLSLTDVTSTSYIEAYGTTQLDGVTCTTLYVDSSSDVSTGENGVTLTGAEAIRLVNFSGDVETLLDSFLWNATSEGEKYVGLSGTFGNTTLSALPEGFTGDYKMRGNVTLQSGATMTLAEGGSIGNTGSYTLTINGTLAARNETLSDALTSTQNGYINISSGGQLLLENAAVNMAGSGSYINIASGGVLEMNGGSLHAAAGVRNAGVAELVGVETNSYISNTGTLTLEDVSCTTLHVDSDCDVITRGTGVTLTGEEVLRLTNFSGSVETLFDSITWSATNTGVKYIGLSGNLGNATLSAQPEGFANVYKLMGSTSVNSGATVVLGDGVQLVNTSSMQLNINGTLQAAYSSRSAFISTSQSYCDVYVQSGGRLLLENADVDLRAGGNYFRVQSGGTLEMTGGSVVVADGLRINSGATASLTGVIVESNLYVSNGATVSLTNSAVNGTLSIDGRATITAITGNDFSNTTFSLSNFSSGQKIDLSGNYWGTDDITEIFAMLGSAAAYVTIDGIIEDTLEELTVSNTNDSGPGSLRNAILSLNSSSTIRDISIRMSEEVAGQTIVLNSALPVITAPCTIEGAGITLSGYGMTCSTDVEFKDITLPKITLSGTGSISGENVVLTNQEAVLLQNWSSVTSISGVTATAEGAYVGITGTLGDSTFTALPETLAGGYKVLLNSDVTIAAGKTVKLEEGVCWQLLKTTSYSQYLNVSGTLVVDNETVADALVAISGSPYLRIQNGGKVQLANANVTGFYNIYTQSGGAFEMTGGTLDSANAFQVSSGGTATLSGVTVKDYISNSGTLNMVGGTSNSYISSTGVLNMRDVVSTSYIEAMGVTTLDGVTCAALYVDSDADVSTGEGGVTLTGEEAIRLQNFSGNVATLLNSFAWSTEAEGAYVGITGTLGDSTFTALPETLAGGYKVQLNSDVTIASGKTVTLEEGVCWQMLKTTSYSQYLNVSGTLVVDNETVADALVAISGSPYLRIQNGGKVQLTNANVTGFYNIYTQSGGAFEMTGGTLDSSNAFQVNSGGTATLSGVTVKDYISNSGTLNMVGDTSNSYISSTGVLNMRDVVSTSYIEAMGVTTLDGVTCTTLRVDSDADVSTGEGGVTLTGEEAIRLQNFSGNVATLLNSFAWSTEAEGAYVGITGTLGDSTFTALPETLAGGYKVQLNSDVTIASGKTVTLEEGICWQMLKTTSYYQYLNVNGTLVVDNETVADALVSVSGAPCLRINNGGKVQLANANVTGFYYISTQSGGTFEMTGGMLDSVNDFQVSSGGTATLSGVTVKDNITASGALVLEDCAFTGNTVQVYNTATVSIVNTSGIKTLTIDGRATVTEISGNDFSGTTLQLNTLSADNKIDLSGNYWGEGVTREEIIAKIKGYNADCVILDNWMVGLPDAEFAARSLVGDTLASAGTRSMTVRFSHELEESSIAGNVYLENLMGDRVEITSWSQQNGDLTLNFDALPADGLYYVVLGAGLTNVYGKSLTVKEGNADCRFEFSADIVAESVESIRLPQSDAPGYFDIMLSGEVDGSTLRAADIRLLTPGGEEVSITRAEMHTTRIIRVYVASLPEAGEYALTLPTSLTDAAGNSLVQAGSAVNFTVESTDPAIVPASQVYSGLTNGSVEVRFSVSNAGNLAVENGKVEIWLTANGVVSADSVLLDIATVESLAAGGSLELTRTLLLSDVPGLAEGSYQLVATVSGAGELKVLADDNSAGIGTLEVSYPPAADIALGLTSAATTLTPGAGTVVTLSIANQGTVTAASVGEVVFGIIPAGGSVADMVQIGSFDLSNVSLAVGSNLAVNRTLTIPGDVKLDGPVQLVAVLRTDTYEQPGTTANNTALTEAVQLEKLLSISASVASITEGSSTRVAYTITRTGDCSKSLVVNLSSEQAARLGLPQTVTISAGQSSARVQARVVNDMDYTGNVDAAISVSAAGYTSASTNLTIVDDEKPSITITLEPVEVTEGADAVVRGTVSINTICTVDTIVKLGSNFSNQIKTPSSVTIKAGESSVSFEAAVVDDNTAEIDKNVQITGAANGFNSGSATVKVVDNDLPEVELVLSREIVSESDGYYALTATLVRRGGSNEAITVKLQDVDGIGLILPSSVPMGAGVQSVKFTIGVVDDALANGERTGRIRGSIIIDDCGCDASSSTDGGMLETTLTVQDNDSPALTVKLSKSVLREGGAEVATLTVTSNYVSDVDVVVSLTDGGLLNLPATITIPAGSTSATCEVTAKADGVSDGTQYTTIMATADGFISGRGYMQVTDIDMPDLVVDSITLEGAAIAGQQSQVSVVIRNQGYVATESPTAVEIRLSDGTVLGTVRIERLLAAGESMLLTTQVTFPQVSGQFALVADVDKSSQNAELDETNNTKVSSNFTISTGYSLNADIVQDVLYTEGVFTIRGSVESDMGLNLGGHDVSIYIYRNGVALQKINAVTADDGSYAVDYIVPKGMCGEFSVRAGLLSDMSETLDSVSVAGLSLGVDNGKLQWMIEKGSSTSGSITVTNTGMVDLHGVHLQIASLPENVQISLESSPVDLAAGQSASFSFTITGDECNTGKLYSAVELQAVSAEGTTVDIKGYSYVRAPEAILEILTPKLDFSTNADSVRYVEFTVRNMGGGDTGKITVTLPQLEWLSIYSGGEIENLSSGESAVVVLKVDASKSDIVYNYLYKSGIAVNAENAPGKVVDMNCRFVSDAKGSLTVNVFDAFSLQLSDNKVIASARITLYDAHTNEVVASGTADENGCLQLTGLEAGRYYLQVRADNCDDYKALVSIEPGDAEYQAVYLANKTVTYNFVVTPTQIEDKYEIVQETEFVTNVPHAVVVFNDSSLTVPELEYGESVIMQFTVSNYGLVAAQSYTLTLPTLGSLNMEVLNPIDRLEAQSSHTFHVLVTAPEAVSESKSGLLKDWACVNGFVTHNWFDCTTNGEWRFNSVTIQTEDDCPTNSGNSGGGGGWVGFGGWFVDVDDIPLWDPADLGTRPIGPGTPTYTKSTLQCTPCRAAIANAFLVCKGWDKIEWSVNPDWCTVVSLGVGIFFPVAGAVIKFGCEAYDAAKRAYSCGVKLGEAFAECFVIPPHSPYSPSDMPFNDDLPPIYIPGFGNIPVPFSDKAGAVEVVNPTVDPWTLEAYNKYCEIELRRQCLLALSLRETGPFDLRSLYADPDIELEVISDWCKAMETALSQDGDEGYMLSEAELRALRNTRLHSQADAAFLEAMYEKWNRTIQYNNRGIYSLADVPEGESTDFYSTEYLESVNNVLSWAENRIVSEGYTDPVDYFYDSTDDFEQFVTGSTSEVCATVRLRFSQTATLTREAFDGELTLSNNAGSDLTNVCFRVYVQDANGVDVSDLFSIKYYEMDGLDSIEGGLVAAGSTATVRIQYVPDKTVAADGSADYYFGGTLSYTDAANGETSYLTLTPVTLQVNPSPNLELHYFLTEDVYSDDPFTANVEAAQAAEIGLIVKNSGKGIAHNFTMSDFHPEYLENETGLALELNMLGSSLNGGERQKSGSSLFFGDIEGESTSTAVWYFATNIHGYFTNYTSTFTHVSDLGDERFSLIESTVTHMLTRSMNLDGDDKTDFLVNDEDDAFDMADGIYFGDGTYASVHGVTGVHSYSGTLDGRNHTIALTMYAEEGWNYFRINDPGMGKWRIESISVGGVELDPSAFWQTDRVFAADGTASYVNRLHWVSEFANASYVEFNITYSAVDESAPKVTSITGITDKTTTREAVETITVTFDEDVNTDTFSLANMDLQLEGESVDLTGLSWEWVDSRTLRLTNLGEYTAANGLYRFQVLNGGLEDMYGNAGEGSGQQVMWTHVTSRVAVQYVEGHTDRKLNKSVNELVVTFTDPVAYFMENAVEVVYRALDGSVTELTSLEGLTITRLDNEGKIFLISGLSGLQTCGDGYYELTVNASRVVDASGSAGMGNLPVSWALHQTPPSVVYRSFVKAELTLREIDTINLHFSHAVSSLNLSKLTLTCNGEVYTSDSLSYSIDANDPTLVTVKGISKAVPVGKAASSSDGAWQLSVDMSGVEDIYGNIGSGVYSTDWELDTVAPDALTGITLNGSERLMVADTTFTLGAALPESGLTVSIYENSAAASGLGTLLWSGVVEGDMLSQRITLLNAGVRTLSIVTSDASGNATTNSYNVLVDMVALTVETDLAAKYKEQPDSVTLTFNAAIAELPLSALSLTVNGAAVSLEGATVSKVSDTEWKLSGLSALCDTVGSYTFGVDLSQLTKSASGLAGQGSYTQSFAYDPITEVRITSCELSSEVELVTGLRMAFNADINYAALQSAGLLGAAVRLVNQADGSVVELDAAGFAYVDKVLSWRGEVSLPGGHYAVVVDTALLKAANGSPLVGNAGTADTAIVDYRGDALLLGAAGTSYSAPYAVDWNGDGHADLLVGEKVGSAGKVLLYLNNGSGGFANFSYLQSNGADLSVAASGCQGIVVALQDITGDGVADLVAGLSNGEVQYFTGLEGGSFGSASTLVEASVAGSRAYPVFADWNADGVADLVLGTGSGTLMVGQGSMDAATGALSFATPTLVAGIEVPGRAAPVFTDVNADGREDLILGAGDGSLTLYYGTEGGFSKVGSWQLEGISWERSRVTVADLNADGRTDLIVGGSTGDIYVVYGSAPAGTWTQEVEIESGCAITSTSTVVNKDTVTLAWETKNATAETRYLLEVADNASFENATQYAGLTGSSMVLAGHAEGNFFWRVQIVDSGKPAVSGDAYVVDITAPGAPADMAVSVVHNTAVLSWAAQADASGVLYEVRYSASADDFSAARIITTTEPCLNLSGMPAGTWYWQVRAVDGAGNAGEWTTAAESFSIDEFVAPESPAGEHWAQGLVVSDKQLVSGYWDADKTGTGDTQLCWAAVSSNMLAWWQSQYGVADFSSSEVPATADDIFATFRQNWANVSGREEYGLTWWVSGESENTSYGSFYSNNFTGSSEQGAYYAPHYDAAATSGLVKEISLTGASAEQVARDWSAVYADGGMMGLGIYRSLSGTTLIGGHTLTLWGFATDAAGRLTSITVSDSDDGTDGVFTLALAYNLTKGYYQIVQSGSNLNGCLLGDYTTLGAFDKADLEDNTAAGAMEITMSEPVNGVSKSTAEHYDWVGTGDTQDFYTFTAPGDGIYRINVNTTELESALWMSVGTLDAAGEFVAVTQTQITPGAPISGISGLRLDSGEPQYICISQAEGATGTAYELNITGDIDEASPITDNNVKRKATKLVGTIYADATVSSWVGSGDALDIYYFDLTEDCNFSLSLSELDKNAKVKLYYDYGDGSYGSIISTTVRAARGLSFTDTLEQGTYYLEIASYDQGAGRYNTGYTLEMEKEIDGVSTRLSLESDSPFTENNTKETATELELVPSTDAVITSWVGAGDALDCYSFNVNQAGTLSLCLSELEKNATVRLYHATENGYQQTLSTTVRAARGLDAELTLATGTYFLEIASYDNGAGRYNTTYALELEKEEDGETKRYAIAGSGL